MENLNRRSFFAHTATLAGASFVKDISLANDPAAATRVFIGTVDRDTTQSITAFEDFLPLLDKNFSELSLLELKEIMTTAKKFLKGKDPRETGYHDAVRAEVWKELLRRGLVRNNSPESIRWRYSQLEDKTIWERISKRGEYKPEEKRRTEQYEECRKAAIGEIVAAMRDTTASLLNSWTKER